MFNLPPSASPSDDELDVSVLNSSIESLDITLNVTPGPLSPNSEYAIWTSDDSDVQQGPMRLPFPIQWTRLHPDSSISVPANERSSMWNPGTDRVWGQLDLDIWVRLIIYCRFILFLTTQLTYIVLHYNLILILCPMAATIK